MDMDGQFDRTDLNTLGNAHPFLTRCAYIHEVLGDILCHVCIFYIHTHPESLCRGKTPATTYVYMKSFSQSRLKA